MLACTALQRLDDGVDARRVGGASRDNNSLTMTTSSPGRWDVQPASPWISMRPFALIPLALFVVAIITHTSAVLIGFAIATLGAATYLCLLLWSLRRATPEASGSTAWRLLCGARGGSPAIATG